MSKKFFINFAILLKIIKTYFNDNPKKIDVKKNLSICPFYVKFLLQKRSALKRQTFLF